MSPCTSGYQTSARSRGHKSRNMSPRTAGYHTDARSWVTQSRDIPPGTSGYQTEARRRMTSVGVMAAWACAGPPGGTTYTRWISFSVSSSSTCRRCQACSVP